MFDPLRKRRMEKLAEKAERYLIEYYYDPGSIRFSSDLDDPSFGPEAPAEDAAPSGGVKYSLRDNYNSGTIRSAMRGLSDTASPLETLRTLDAYTDLSFVDKMLEYINVNGLRDADVYKAAMIDRRLFSKIVSDSSYKPAKDTCVALCLALRLTLQEANDLLSRAGYAFSHSNKRDVILEFCFREQIYNLIDVNDLLFRLDQKILGR